MAFGQQLLIGLPDDAADDALAAGIVQPCVGESRRAGEAHLAAELADALYKSRVFCTVACGRRRRRRTTTTS